MRHQAAEAEGAAQDEEEAMSMGCGCTTCDTIAPAALGDPGTKVVLAVGMAALIGAYFMLRRRR